MSEGDNDLNSVIVRFIFISRGLIAVNIYYDHVLMYSFAVIRRAMDARDDVDGNCLEIRLDVGGLRHYLCGEPIHAGDQLSIRLGDGTWVVGRYEWSYLEDDLPFVVLDSETDEAVSLRTETHCRWPS